MSFIGILLDFISPRACCVCGERLSSTEDTICTVCNWHIPRTNYASTPYDNELARLFWGRFQIEKAASWFFYQSHSGPSKLIYDLKYHHKPEIGLWLGKVSASEFAETDFFESIDYIVAVPITFRRRWHRGYNQSSYIVQGISKVTGIPVLKNVIKRTSFSGSQTYRDVLHRVENVQDAFCLRHPELIRGKHILLVDDIITSGSTISSCADELSKAGDVRISIMSIGCAKS